MGETGLDVTRDGWKAMGQGGMDKMDKWDRAEWDGKNQGLHLFAVNLGASAHCLEIVHSISTIRHSAQLFGTIAPYSA